jgi:hypothetical protein
MESSTTAAKRAAYSLGEPNSLGKFLCAHRGEGTRLLVIIPSSGGQRNCACLPDRRPFREQLVLLVKRSYEIEI